MSVPTEAKALSSSRAGPGGLHHEGVSEKEILARAGDPATLDLLLGPVEYLLDIREQWQAKALEQAYPLVEIRDCPRQGLLIAPQPDE